MVGVEERLNDICIVSEWMENGNLTTYLFKLSEAQALRERLQVVRMHGIETRCLNINNMYQLVDICEGLKYLHSEEIPLLYLQCSLLSHLYQRIELHSMYLFQDASNA